MLQFGQTKTTSNQKLKNSIKTSPFRLQTVIESFQVKSVEERDYLLMKKSKSERVLVFIHKAPELHPEIEAWQTKGKNSAKRKIVSLLYGWSGSGLSRYVFLPRRRELRDI